MATARKKSTASVRRLVSEAVTEGYGKEDIANIIAAAKGAETKAAAECPECGHTMRVSVPDFRKQLDTLIELLEQAEGKASQAIPEATKIEIIRPPR